MMQVVLDGVFLDFGESDAAHVFRLLFRQIMEAGLYFKLGLGTPDYQPL
jgi:hypothetical protein